MKRRPESPPVRTLRTVRTTGRSVKAPLFVAVGVLLFACAAPTGLEHEQPTHQAQAPAVPADAFEATVLRVIDGDTFLASRDGRRVRVRLIGIDAPESVQPEAPIECFGRESADRLRQLLPEGTSVRASFQGPHHEDRFGRDLWDVWLPHGPFVNAEMVRGGYAEARAYPPHTQYAETLAAEERVARNSGKGIHRDCRP